MLALRCCRAVTQITVANDPALFQLLQQKAALGHSLAIWYRAQATFGTVDQEQLEVTILCKGLMLTTAWCFGAHLMI
jgi:hypothetical protein